MHFFIDIPLAALANKARNKQKMAFACSACAAVYKTEEGLKLHQEVIYIFYFNNNFLLMN